MKAPDLPDFQALMSSRTDDQLLSIVANGHEYQSAALEAAIAELQHRHVSGFEIEAARDLQKDQAKLMRRNNLIGLSWRMKLLLLLLPFLFISPWGLRRYYQWQKTGFELKCEQMAAWSMTGFICYLLGFSFFPSYALLHDAVELAWHWLFVMKS